MELFFEDGALKRQLKLSEVIRVDPNPMTNAFIRRRH